MHLDVDLYLIHWHLSLITIHQYFSGPEMQLLIVLLHTRSYPCLHILCRIQIQHHQWPVHNRRTARGGPYHGISGAKHKEKPELAGANEIWKRRNVLESAYVIGQERPLSKLLSCFNTDAEDFQQPQFSTATPTLLSSCVTLAQMYQAVSSNSIRSLQRLVKLLARSKPSVPRHGSPSFISTFSARS